MTRSKNFNRALCLWLLIILIITGIIFQLLTLRSPGRWHPPPVSYLSSNASHEPKTLSHEDQEEIQRLMKLIEWPEAPSGVDFMSSTSPNTTFYVLSHPQEVYHVGDRITVVITARDHYGRPKTYGGDYFLAKLHSPQLKAGVTGSVTDHRNGSYSATFLLLWPGDAEVHISLVHSSEAVSIISRKRDSRPDKVKAEASSYCFWFVLMGSSIILMPADDGSADKDSLRPMLRRFGCMIGQKWWLKPGIYAGKRSDYITIKGDLVREVQDPAACSGREQPSRSP